VRVFKAKWFVRYARKEGIDDSKLVKAIHEAEKGLIDADYGGGLIKKRIARDGAGKSGGYRTLIAYKSETRSLFFFGYAKSALENVDDADLKEYKIFSQLFLAYSDADITNAINKGVIEEVEYNGEEI
jgi:hypothetical protein